MHAQLTIRGFDRLIIIGNLLVQMYGKCCSLHDARSVFDKMGTRNLYSWTMMIRACAQNMYGEEALELYCQMQAVGIHPDKVTFIYIIDLCGSVAALSKGREIHASIFDHGCHADVALENALINMYCKCSSLDEARSVFLRMHQRDVISWNTMIAACAQNGHDDEALHLSSEMHAEAVESDEITFVGSLDACTNLADLAKGREIHARTVGRGYESNVVVGTALINMYGKCGSLGSARVLFSAMPCWTVVTWNAMITACSQNGYGEEALHLFQQMQANNFMPDKFTCASVLDACANLAALTKGSEIHLQVVNGEFESDIYVWTALINMYSKCGSLNHARTVFGQMPQRNVSSWNAMIGACAEHEHSEEAMTLFNEMQALGTNPNEITFLCVLDACASLQNVRDGQEIHNSIICNEYDSDMAVGTALVNMYGKCRSLEDARTVFCQMSEKDVFAWNTMIAASIQNECAMEGLHLFSEMQDNGIEPNKITFVCVLDAFTRLAALEEGRETHASIVSFGYGTDINVGTSLVDMYGKCGNLKEARIVFDRMPRVSVVSWNALIGACAQNGQCNEALDLFCQMQATGAEPDEITFVSILTACSHTGLVDNGRSYFLAMNRDYGLTPLVVHYVCLADIFGRAGQLNEAEDMIDTMPYETVPSVWLSLLSVCKVHGDVERAKRAAKHLLKLDARSSPAHVLLADIHAAAGR